MEQALPVRSDIPPWQALGLSLALHVLLAWLLVALGMKISQHPALPVHHGALHISLLARAPATIASASANPALPLYRKVPAVTTPVMTPAATTPVIVTTASAAVTTAALPANTATAAPASAVTGTTTSADAGHPDNSQATLPAPQAEAPLVAATADAAYLDNPRPEYPQMARMRGLEGLVTLTVVVSPDGSPLSESVFSSSHFSLLDRAAIAAVSLWHFVPAHRGSTAVEDTVKVPVRFSLHDQG